MTGGRKARKRPHLEDLDHVAESRSLGKQQPASPCRLPASRLSSNLAEWMQKLADHIKQVQPGGDVEAKERRKMDAFWTLKFGLRLADFEFEHSIYQRLGKIFLDRPLYCMQVLRHVWGLQESPLRLLEYPSVWQAPCHLGQDDCVNASEVIDGFAFLAAGGYRPGAGAMHKQKPLMIGHTCRGSEVNRDRQREQDIAAWLGRNRVRYILNLARDDPDMGTQYPAVPGTSGFKQVDPDWMLDSTNDDELPDDADDDECVWVLSLPIKDEAEHDMFNKHLMQGARFIERAWRRHKKVLHNNMLQEVSASTDIAPDRRQAGGEQPKVRRGKKQAATIVIHCFGGIQRSPLVLICWLYRFAFNRKPTASRLPAWSFEEIYQAVKKKREVLYLDHMRNNKEDEDGVVLNLPFHKQWCEDVQRRVDAEHIRHAPDLAQPSIMGMYSVLAKCRHDVFGGSDLSHTDLHGVLHIDCGGIGGEPFSDSDGDDYDPALDC